MTDPFLIWHDSLEKRYLSALTFQEVRRAVQALSAIYVEQRERIDSGAVLNGAGKRAAFAMFYAPIHFLFVREVVRALGAAQTIPTAILDLGCGTGTAGVAWALECNPIPKLMGVDRHPWVLEECNWTYRAFGLRASTRGSDIRTVRVPPNTAVISAFTMNELDDENRGRFLKEFSKVSREGSPVLIIEPIARRLAKWWDPWAVAFKANGGREDQWRFTVELPEKLRLMDRAAGLDHRELTGRSLWLPGATGT
jgi:hypothetical protein